MVRWSAVALLPFSVLACNGCHDGGAPPVAAESRASIASSAAPPSDSAALAGAKEAAIHVEDDGKSFDVARGSIVRVALPSNAGTGYVWLPTRVDANVLAQQGERTSDVSSDIPGAAKMDVYRFAAAAPGTTALEMSLKRPFGSGGATRTVHVTVNVH